MKKVFFLFSFIFLISSLFAQSLELNDKLPNDPKVIHGTLKNGMKYYIRSNKNPENRAEFALSVNAGSVLEDDDQQGLAHFTEHMAFNGTKNFPKNELVNYLESLGMKFGPEVNAYTSFDETFYGIKVPMDKPEFVDKGLLVLFDWASQLSLETEEINAERGIIHEEWRMGQGAMDRMQRKFLPVIFHNSIYADRLPIGLMDVVDNCDPEALRRFYRDWYRPDLMAVIIVGDFDAKEMERKVIDLFSQIPARENPRERFYPEIPDHKETLVSVATDSEAPISMIQMFYKHPRKQKTTVADYKEDLVAALVSQMISKRLSELTLLENPPFTQAMAAYTDFIGPKSMYISFGIIQNNDVEKTLKALVRENQRMVVHGFTATELEREKQSILKMYEKQYNEREKRKSEEFLQEYKSNFLPPHDPFPGIEYEYELAKKYIPLITLDEVNAFASKLTPDENCVIVVIAPEKEGVKIPSEQEVLKIYNQTRQEKVDPYVDKVVDKPLISELPKTKKGSKVIKNKEMGYETWILKNGVKVVVKSTNFKDDEILFEARSKGGNSLYEDKDVFNASIATEVAQESGLGDFDKAELDKYLAGKNVALTPYIAETFEGLRGNSSVSDFETLLQMIYVSFTKPRIVESSFNSYINKQKAMYENAALDPQNAWQDTIAWLVANYHPRKKPFDASSFDNADLRMIKRIYNQRFADPNNFTFYFVGNIDVKKHKPLIEKYLGALPVVERNETYRDLGIRPPKTSVDKVVNKGKDQKCVKMIIFSGEMDYTLENRQKLDAICKILSTRLLEEIREKESGVYTIGAYPRMSAEPYGNYMIYIFFSTDPQREAELTAKIFDIIKSLQNDGLNDVDLQKAKEKQKRELETNLKENNYWLRLIMDCESEFISDKDFANYNNLIENTTIPSLKDAFNKFINLNKHYKVALLPEE